MYLSYFDLPFGAQLLLWTSRLMLNGSCRSVPSKYEIINIAYDKVGITNGSVLLKEVLDILKKQELFILQQICIQKINGSEFNFINCIENNKKNVSNNDTYIEMWNLAGLEKPFITAVNKLSLAFKKSNLNTNLSTVYLSRNISNKETLITKTLH